MNAAEFGADASSLINEVNTSSEIAAPEKDVVEQFGHLGCYGREARSGYSGSRCDQKSAAGNTWRHATDRTAFIAKITN
jgi:hypothetical protein